MDIPESATIEPGSNAERALRESEDRYRDLVENSLVLIGTHDAKGRILSLNRAAANLLEIPNADDLAGRSLTEYVPPDLMPQFDQYLETILRDGHAEGLMVIATPSGKTRIVGYRNTLRRQDKIEPIVRWTGQEVTEKIQAEKAQAFLASLVESSQDAIIGKTLEGIIVSWNHGAEELYGYRAQEVVGKSISILAPPDRAAELAPLLEKVRRGEQISAYETVRVRKDGDLVDVSLTISPVRDATGEITGVVTIAQDITERKRVEEARRDNEEKHRVLYESSGDAIMMLAPPKWEFTAGNPAAIVLFGAKDEQEFVATAPWTLSPEYQPDGELSSVKAPRMIATAMKTGSHFFEWTHKKFSGEEIFATVTLTRMIYRGQPLLQATARDITERKRAETLMAERHRLAALVAEVGMALTGAENMRQGLQRCAEILVRNIDAAFARVWTLNEAEKVLELQASAGMYTHIDGGHARVPIGKFKIGRIAESGEPHLTNSVQKDSWVGDPEWARREGMVAFAGYPLKVEERVLGVVAAFARKPLSEATLQAFASVADNIAQFIKRKRAEEALRDGEERYRVLYESSRDAIMMTAPPDWKFAAGNPAAIALFGARDEQEFVAAAPWTLSPEYQPDGELSSVKAPQMIAAAMERGSNFFEWTHKRFSGEEFLATVALTRMIHRGQPLLQATVRDITERKQAEEKTRLQTAALESAANGIAIADREGRILWVNSAFTRLTGYSAEEVLGQTMRVLKSGEQDANFYQKLWQTILSGEVWRGELVNRRKNGSLYIDETTITPVRDASDALTHFVAIKQNVTERRQAERALEERTVYLNTLFEISPMGIVVLDTEGCIEMSNSAFERLFLYSHQEIMGVNLDNFIVPEGMVSEARTMNTLCLSGAGAQSTSRRRRKDGTMVDVNIYGVPLVIEGKLRGSLALYHDITERRRAEEGLVKYAEELEISQAAQQEHAEQLARLVQELAQERELLRALMDNLPDYIYFKDLQSRFIRTNSAHAKAFGLSDPAQAVGKADFDFFTAEHAQQAYNDEQEVINTGKPMMAKEEKETWPDGRETWVSTTKMPLRDANGAIIGTFGVSHDITEGKLAEIALRASEARYRELFENASDIVFTADLDLRLTSLNRVAEQTIGYSREEAAQMSLRQLVDPKHWQRMEHALERLLTGESAVQLEVEITAKDGRLMMLEVKPRLVYKGGKPAGVQGIGRDITGRDVAEVELRHTQKLESVGRLASGIAHEINTPIQFVGDNTRFLQDSFGDLQTLLAKYQELRDAANSGPVRPELLAEVRQVEETSDCAYLLEEIPKALTQTLDGVTRVATIVRAMKEFAHPEGKEMAATDLNRALLSTLTVARNELKYVADVETEFGELPLVVCNVGDINQVFLNLLVNAAHAIGESVKGTGQKGKIRVSTAPEGSGVLITISDTGCGIPEANRTKVFDPFFTTKEVGRGTGQGLAIARSVVVERHKGTLTFASEVGKGTTFSIRLPIDPGEGCKETRAP